MKSFNQSLCRSKVTHGTYRIDPSADQGAIEPTCRITSADGSESEYMFDEDADEVQVVAIVSSL